jgi:hypothetical protein
VRAEGAGSRRDRGHGGRLAGSGEAAGGKGTSLSG